jgi:hypothetical protein
MTTTFNGDSKMCNCPENVFCSAQLCPECVAEFEAKQEQDFQDDMNAELAQAEADAWNESEEEQWELEDDGQPSTYEEYQDLYGGDDWDFGQYDGFFSEDF